MKKRASVASIIRQGDYPHVIGNDTVIPVDMGESDIYRVSDVIRAMRAFAIESDG